MRFPGFARGVRTAAVGFLSISGLVAGINAAADQVELSNGDRYIGRVVALNSNTLTLQSDVLGTLRLPRAAIQTITLDSRSGAATTNATIPSPSLLRSNSLNKGLAGTSTNSAGDFSAALRQLGSQSNTLRQVQEQLLTGAGPEAQAKFNELLGGLLSGKVDLDGLRAEAKSTLEQARKVRGDIGEEGAGMLDSYLAILDSFLRETEPASVGTNKAPSSAKAKPQTTLKEE
jgi:hypothetical protein